MRATRDAQRICTSWRLDGLRDPGFGRRMEIFCGPGWDDPTNGRPRPSTPPPTRSPSPWPGCSPARTARAHPRQQLGLARRIHRRTTPHRRPRLHLGLPPARPLAPRPDDPLLEWRLHTRRLKLEPLPPDHEWNLPETIQPAALAALTDRLLTKDQIQ